MRYVYHANTKQNIFIKKQTTHTHTHTLANIFCSSLSSEGKCPLSDNIVLINLLQSLCFNLANEFASSFCLPLPPPLLPLAPSTSCTFFRNTPCHFHCSFSLNNSLLSGRRGGGLLTGILSRYLPWSSTRYLSHANAGNLFSGSSLLGLHFSKMASIDCPHPPNYKNRK